MDNLFYYNQFKAVPEEAKKEIKGGRLKGFTDINPVWRIRTLTESFGPCGVGWNVNLVNERIIPGGKDEVAVFIDVELKYKLESGEWSEPVFGTGGSLLVANESSGVRLDDEAFKKAYTDAISVACKALGIGADVYWSKDSTKYTSGSSAENSNDAKNFSKDEADKLRKIIIGMAAKAGRDEKRAIMFAEELVETATKTFVKWADMDVGLLTKVKVELAKRIS